MLTILLVSTADTELLAAAASGAGYLTANPAQDRGGRGDRPGRPGRPRGAAAPRRPEGLARGRGRAHRRLRPLPLVALGGEAAPDAELMALSTVPAGVATEALGYLREGGPENLRELARFLSDTIFLTGEGFDPPQPDARLRAPPPPRRPGHAPADGPAVVAVVFYRAHELSGNTAFVDTLCAALAEHGANRPHLCVCCASLLGSADAGLADPAQTRPKR